MSNRIILSLPSLSFILPSSRCLKCWPFQFVLKLQILFSPLRGNTGFRQSYNSRIRWAKAFHMNRVLSERKPRMVNVANINKNRTHNRNLMVCLKGQHWLSIIDISFTSWRMKTILPWKGKDKNWRSLKYHCYEIKLCTLWAWGKLHHGKELHEAYLESFRWFK